MIKIDKDIPPPAGTGQGSKIYPFDSMEVGDSFFVMTNHTTVRNSINQWQIRNRKRHWKFTVRKEGNGGVRVWRLEDKPNVNLHELKVL